MDSAEFRPAQRRKTLTIGWICAGVALLGVGGVAAAPEVGGWTGVFVLPGLVGLFLAPLTLNVAYGRTVLTSHGIRTSRVFSRHSCPWSEVMGIDTKKVQGGRGTWNTWVVVKLHDGRNFKLAAPFDSRNGLDPKFHEKVGQILRYWARVRGEQIPGGTNTD